MELPLTPLEFARRTRSLYADREPVVDGKIPISGGTNCAAGGRINVTGNVDDNGNGAYFVDVLGTVTDCRAGGSIFNGEPYVSITGTFSFLNGAPATQQYLRVGGGVKWRNAANQTCPLNLTVNYSTATSGGTVSGSMCNVFVNYSF